jgi:hypothetical protein
MQGRKPDTQMELSFQTLNKSLDDSIEKANRLRDNGISRSVNHADDKLEDWSIRAYSFLEEYCKLNKVFMGEDVRVASDGIVPEPPSKRAWGAVMLKAAKNNLIINIGFSRTKSEGSHRGVASLWESKLIF